MYRHCDGLCKVPSLKPPTYCIPFDLLNILYYTTNHNAILVVRSWRLEEISLPVQNLKLYNLVSGTVKG